MAVYPTSLVSFTTKTNKVDIVDAEHINTPQGEIIALQTYVGTNPHGNRDSLATRIGYMVDTYGGVIGSSAFPTGSNPRRLFYRDDLEQLYIGAYSGTAFNVLGGSLSNVVFQYAGSHLFTGGLLNGSSRGEAFSTNAIIHATQDGGYRYFYCYPADSGTNVFHETIFKKVAGISNIICHALVQGTLTSGSGSLRFQVNIGSAVGTSIAIVPSLTQSWYQTNINVSSLVNGSNYTVYFSGFFDNTPGASRLNVYHYIGIAQ